MDITIVLTKLHPKSKMPILSKAILKNVCSCKIVLAFIKCIHEYISSKFSCRNKVYASSKIWSTLVLTFQVVKLFFPWYVHISVFLWLYKSQRNSDHCSYRKRIFIRRHCKYCKRYSPKSFRTSSIAHHNKQKFKLSLCQRLYRVGVCWTFSIDSRSQKIWINDSFEALLALVAKCICCPDFGG